MTRTLRGSSRRASNPGLSADIDPRLAKVIACFAQDRAVEYGGGKGFGSAALKVNGRIFAMLASGGAFVVKLPRERVAELVSGGAAEYFDPGTGRLMKEWAACRGRAPGWLALAAEARQFVGSQQASPAVKTRRRKRRVA
jgi:hypothetical protein